MPGGIEITPVDDLTKLPLPVFVQKEDYLADLAKRARSVNFHHHFHPKRSIELGYDPAGTKLPIGTAERIEGIALRASRGQEMPVWLHNRYHDLFYGPKLPETTKEKFVTTVLACAGVVPDRAIDMHDVGGFQVVNLEPKEHELISRKIYFESAKTPIKRVRSKNNMGRFLADYIINNSLDEIVNENEVLNSVRKFILPKNERTRVEAANLIIDYAVRASVENIEPILKEAIQRRMVKHPRRSLGEVVLKYFSVEKYADYYAPMEDKLIVYA